MTNKLKPEDVTPENIYNNRRAFLKTSIFAATGLATAGIYRFFRKKSPDALVSGSILQKKFGNDSTTSLENITHYNNYYEFSTDKEAVAEKAKNWNITSWNMKIDGMVDNPYSLNLSDLSELKVEERIYRFRCVEGWSMIIPWQGIQLSDILKKAAPQSSAKYVAFETYYNENDMPDARSAGLPFPYVEGLRIDEAMNPLTLLATGIYGKKLANQNGAPVRLVVPWKYGFKNIKSIVRITLTDKEPPSTWNLANPNEYGFYSNVNPEVDHPRWSQKMERLIGESELRPTLMFNGYEKEVAHMYVGMDLRKDF